MCRKGYKQTSEHIAKRLDTGFYERPEYREKMSKSLSGSNNPRFGVKLSEELKKRISESEKGKTVVVTDEQCINMSRALKGKYIGEKHWLWKGGRKNQRVLHPLLFAIRNCKKYLEWREAVLKLRIPSYPNIPKNIQVHHLHRVMDIIKEHNIQTLDDALNCDELWDVDNGVVMTKGEHFIISHMERYKKVSVGFITFLEDFIQTHKQQENKQKAVELNA